MCWGRSKRALLCPQVPGELLVIVLLPVRTLCALHAERECRAGAARGSQHVVPIYLESSNQETRTKAMLSPPNILITSSLSLVA